jgi:hypothetical protein
MWMTKTGDARLLKEQLHFQWLKREECEYISISSTLQF